MNTENRKTKISNKFCCYFTDKLNLKDPSKNDALVNSSIYYTWKNIKSAYNSNNLIYLLQRGMTNLIYLMDHILNQIFKIILSIFLRKTRL